MIGPSTAAGRGLALWAAALGLWFFADVLKYAGTWQGDLVGFGVSMAFGAGMALLALYGFRRQVARPLPASGMKGWLARQPRRRSALMVGGLWLAVPAGIFLIEDVILFHPSPYAWQLAWFVGLWLIMSVGAGGFWSLVWQRQRERNSQA